MMHFRTFLFAALFCLVPAVILPTATLADTPLGSEFTVAADTGYEEHRPVALHLGGSKYVVVWHQDLPAGSGDDVKARFVIAPTPILDTVFDISLGETAGSQAYPQIAEDGSGEFIVVWQSDASGRSVIRSRRFDDIGTPLASEFSVSSATSGELRYPAVARSSGGPFLVVWQTDADGSEDIVGHYLDSLGTPFGADLVIASATGDESRPDVAGLGSGDFVVVWQHSNGGQLDVEAVQVSGGSSFAVHAATTGNQARPAVAASSDYFLVTWQSDSDGQSQVYFRAFDNSNAADGPETTLDADLSQSQEQTDVVPTSEGDFVVTWSELGPPPTPEASSDFAARGSVLLVRTRRVAGPPFAVQPDLGRKNGVLILNTSGYGGSYPTLAPNTDDGFLGVWQVPTGIGADMDGIRGRFVGDTDVTIFTDGFESGNLANWSSAWSSALP